MPVFHTFPIKVYIFLKLDKIMLMLFLDVNLLKQFWQSLFFHARHFTTKDSFI